jgi:membrane-associated protease RseP (regulator of RpoE activity)
MYPLAILTSFLYAIEGFVLNVNFFNALVKQRNLSILTSRCLPVVGGIFAMQVLHEVVQYLVAKWRGIQVGPPVPVPSVRLGMFGCITPIKSFPPSRAALLDFALSGPFATTIASIGCIVASVILTVRASPAVLATFPVLPALVLKSSLLVGTIISWIASKPLMLPLAQPIPIHPLFLVGYAGLISSGLNLLPIFRLDGGRACTAAMGTRQGAVISVSILLFLLSLALSGGSGLGVGWGIIVALFQRRQEIPARDDVTEVDDVRLGAWMFSFLLSVAILSPFPGAHSIL